MTKPDGLRLVPRKAQAALLAEVARLRLLPESYLSE
jgi:hypothetical protein